MSSTLPRFAKTNGETQKLGKQKEGFGDETLAKEGSGVSAFFKTLKNKLRKTESMSPRAAQLHATSKFADDKTYFVKATGQATMARAFYTTDRHTGGSTVSECAASGNVDGVKRLLNLGGDAEDMDCEGNTALHCAAEAGHEDAVILLIERGADPNAKNEEGETALHKAAINGHHEAVKALILRNINYDAKNKEGWTALHEAACNGRKEVARLLLDCNADPMTCTADGDTVLHKAARWNRVEIVKLLLAVGVDVGARDKAGRTASQRTNSAEIIQLLKSYTGSRQSRRPSSVRGILESDESDEEAGGSDGTCFGDDGDNDDDKWDVGDQSDFYQTQWALFVSSRGLGKKISYSDVPWPGASVSPADIINVVLFGANTQEERKKQLRTELLRWHPDKFQAMFGAHLKPDDAQQIMSKVKEISQAINTAAKHN